MYLGLMLIPCANLLNAALNGWILRESMEDGKNHGNDKTSFLVFKKINKQTKNPTPNPKGLIFKGSVYLTTSNSL